MITAEKKEKKVYTEDVVFHLTRHFSEEICRIAFNSLLRKVKVIVYLNKKKYFQSHW